VFEDISSDNKNLMSATGWIAEQATSLLGAKVVKTVILDDTQNEAQLD